MVARAWIGLVTVVLGAVSFLAAGGSSFGQEPTLPPVPVPVLPRDDRPGIAPSSPVLGPPVPVQYTSPQPPPPPPPLPPASPSVPFAPADPGRDGWGPAGLPSLPESVFFSTELQFVGPYFNNRIVGTLTFPDGSTQSFMVPGANVGWTVSPRFDLGVRLPDGLGE